MKPTLIVDISHWFYPLVFKMPGLSSDEQPTAILFGMANKIIQHATKFQTNQFIFLFDSKKNYRKDIFPGYKQKRREKNKERTPEEKEIFKESFIQLNELRIKMLPKLGFKNIFIQTGHESDDLAASLTINNPDREFIIVTNDEDLYCLLTDNVSIYNSKTEKSYTKQDFLGEWGIDPIQWVDCKKIGGCKSDEVPGVAGVAEKTVAKYLRNELKDSSKKYKDIVSEEGKKIAEFNDQLVRLPFKGTNILEINDNWIFDIKDFISVCESYKFNSLIYGKSFEKYKSVFCGE